MDEFCEILDPDVGVVYGAAMMAGVLSNQLIVSDGIESDSTNTIQPFNASDVVPFSIGVVKKEKDGLKG